MEKRKSSEMEITKFIDDIDKLNKMIKETKEKKIDKEKQKQELNDETHKLRTGIEEQRKILEEKEADLLRIKTDNANVSRDIK